MKLSFEPNRSFAHLREGGIWTKILVFIAVVAILAVFTLGGGHPNRYGTPERFRTVASIAAIRSWLEQYKEKYGHYPIPTAEADSDSGTFGKVEMNCGHAAMLYQAFTGDGNNFVESEDVFTSESDGKLSEEELVNSINGSLPPQMISSAGKKPGEAGPRMLIDGYGRPFQYTPGGSANAVNATYDLWSYGDVKSGVVSEDLETKKSPEKTASWIKLW